MSDIADIMIYVHPGLLSTKRNRIEEDVSELEGVLSVVFDYESPHELTVVFSPLSISSNTILNRVRRWDENAAIF